MGEDRDDEAATVSLDQAFHDFVYVSADGTRLYMDSEDKGPRLIDVSRRVKVSFFDVPHLAGSVIRARVSIEDFMAVGVRVWWDAFTVQALMRKAGVEAQDQRYFHNHYGRLRKSFGKFWPQRLGFQRGFARDDKELEAKEWPRVLPRAALSTPALLHVLPWRAVMSQCPVDDVQATREAFDAMLKHLLYAMPFEIYIVPRTIQHSTCLTQNPPRSECVTVVCSEGYLF